MRLWTVQDKTAHDDLSEKGVLHCDAALAEWLKEVGREFQPDNIDFLLEERELKAKYRRSGGRTRGAKKRTGENAPRFEVGWKELLRDSTAASPAQANPLVTSPYFSCLVIPGKPK